MGSLTASVNRFKVPINLILQHHQALKPVIPFPRRKTLTRHTWRSSMCSDSRAKASSSEASMKVDTDTDAFDKQRDDSRRNSSILLELSAIDDLASFKRVVEEDGHDLDESSLWYGRRMGSNKMAFEERTPLMIAAMFGSKNVLTYILQTGRVDPNRACGSDGATALHCAASSGSDLSTEIVSLLINANADINCVDAYGRQPSDVIAHCPTFPIKSRKSYPADPSLPDLKTGIYSSDEFRMYAFKVRLCARAYSHDWTECPFVHPGENARRRDPLKYRYSCLPCPMFRRGGCRRGDDCEFAHGVFESWLHPAQYRTRFCKDRDNCTRRVCFFAHQIEELRPLNPSTGSAISLDSTPLSPISLGSPSSVLMAPFAYDFIDRSLKSDWETQGEDDNELMKSASLGDSFSGLDVSWIQSIIAEAPADNGGSPMISSSWAEKLFMEQQRNVA